MDLFSKLLLLFIVKVSYTKMTSLSYEEGTINNFVMTIKKCVTLFMDDLVEIAKKYKKCHVVSE